MAKAFGRDPTNNLYAVLLQKDAYGVFEEEDKPVTKQPDQPIRPPGYIPTPAERGEERKKKEEEKKRLQDEQQRIKDEKEKKQKKKAETEFPPKHKSEKLSREQWEIENKKKKLQQPNYIPAPENHPVVEQQQPSSKPQQPFVDKEGFQPVRKNYQQQHQQPQSVQPQSPQHQPFPGGQGGQGGYRQGGQGGEGGYRQGGRGKGQGGQGGQGGYRQGGQGGYRQGGQGGEGGYRQGGEGGYRQGGQGGEGGQGGYRQGGQGGEGQGEHRGQQGGQGGEGGQGGYRQGGQGGENRGRGRGGRNNNNRRGGRGPRGNNVENQPRYEENQNREFNQRGQDLTGERQPGRRQYDRKSGRHVKNINNINVGSQEGQQWYENNPQATTEQGDLTNSGWGDNEAPQNLDNSANNAEGAPQEGGDDWAGINQGTAEAAPTSPAGAPQVTGDSKGTKQPEPNFKTYNDFLTDQKKKKEALDELLAQMAISAPAPRVVESDISGGRYIERTKNEDTGPVKKVKEQKPPKVKAQPATSQPTTAAVATTAPQTTTEAKPAITVEDFFNFTLPKNETRRRFNQDSELSEKGDLINPPQVNTDQTSSEGNNDQRRPKGQRRPGGRGPRGERGQGGQGGQGGYRGNQGGQGGQGGEGFQGGQGGQGGYRGNQGGQGGEGFQGGQGGQGGGRGRGNRRPFNNTSGGGFNNNRGNVGSNLLPTDQPDDWPALVR